MSEETNKEWNNNEWNYDNNVPLERRKTNRKVLIWDVDSTVLSNIDSEGSEVNDWDMVSLKKSEIKVLNSYLDLAEWDLPNQFTDDQIFKVLTARSPRYHHTIIIPVKSLDWKIENQSHEVRTTLTTKIKPLK